MQISTDSRCMRHVKQWMIQETPFCSLRTGNLCVLKWTRSCAKTNFRNVLFQQEQNNFAFTSEKKWLKSFVIPDRKITFSPKEGSTDPLSNNKCSCSDSIFHGNPDNNSHLEKISSCQHLFWNTSACKCALCHRPGISSFHSAFSGAWQNQLHLFFAFKCLFFF